MKNRFDCPNLMRFFPHSEFRSEWLPILAGRRTEWTLPTEFVRDTLMLCMPRVARTYELELFLLPGPEPREVVDYETLRDRNGAAFCGTSTFESVHLCEVYGNDGSDGHVDFLLIGWCFAPSGELMKHERGSTPCPAPGFMLGHADTLEDL